ncbi:uncharacterized protein LOC125196124 [Salvia hispanica]|uniref:uncharacterized protein LOC125196124 n=1 Tax=Salvia hispanica TaxID=49212 RepID=UPI0020091A64|nr:uncharacterized protein LOC125196124 [Salvia hispanica]
MMKCKAIGYQHKDKLMLDEEKFRNLSMLERSTIRKVASKMEVSKTTIGRFIKNNQLKPHTNVVKPTLIEANKIARMKWCLAHIQPTLAEGKLLYHSLHNIVHIDEKWFYMTKTSDRYYLFPDEDEPYRSCKSKRFITKVMFMVAVYRPLIGSDGKIIFDGEIGLFPFTEKVLAKRSSKNRPKETIETKLIQSVNKEVMTACLLNQIVPTIKAKWLANASKKIYIQQDNAKPHLRVVDQQFEEIARGLPLQLYVEEGLVRESLEYLQLPENNAGDAYDIGPLNHALEY